MPDKAAAAGQAIGTAGQAIIAYDGTCGFCEFVVSRMSRGWGLPGTPVPWQRLNLASHGLTRDDAERQLWHISGGVRRGGCAAIAAWLRTGGPAAAALGAVLGAPVISWLGQKIYRCVADRWHKIPGPWEKTCQVPSPVNPGPGTSPPPGAAGG